MFNRFEFPVSSCRLVEFVKGWAAGWLAFGPVLAINLFRSWGWV